eukprot:969894_1
MQTDVTQFIETVRILNFDEDVSTTTPIDIIVKSNQKLFMVSDADEEFLILLQFKQVIDLYSLQIYASTKGIERDDFDVSEPKKVHIFHLKDLNVDVNFDDIQQKKPNNSIDCSIKKMAKGQRIKLQQTSKNAITFKKTQYLAIYVESNQGDTEKTLINHIKFQFKANALTSPNTRFSQSRSKGHPSSGKWLTQEIQRASETDVLTRLMENGMTEETAKQFLANQAQNNDLQINFHDKTPVKGSDKVVPKNVYARTNKQSCEFDIDKCPVLKKLCVTLTDSFNQNGFDAVALQNDFNHSLMQHGEHFETIYNYLIAHLDGKQCCDSSKCMMWRRNNRNRSDVNQQPLAPHSHDDEKQLQAVGDLVRQQLVDRIHCYYLHSFDTGKKIRKETRRTRLIQSAKQALEQGFVDTMISGSNAIKSMRDKPALPTTNDKFIITQHNISTQMDSYNYGYRFFYWPKYKNSERRFDPVHREYAVRTVVLMNTFSFNHKGYDHSVPVANVNSSLGEWYIEQKYQSFKEELLGNSICTINIKEWDALYEKALIHQQTTLVQNMSCANKRAAVWYDVQVDSKMCAEHLIAMMVQCNYDTLQFKFKQTYRKEPSDETDSQLRERHRNYWWLGKLLREMVECFGMDQYIDCEPKYFYRERIRLWVGLSKQFVFPSLFAFIKGPFSTTTAPAVARGFDNNNGLCLELSIDRKWIFSGPDGNQSHNGIGKPIDEFQPSKFQVFDCHWLSDYVNEMEVFCIGGLHKFVFETIKTPEGVDYQLYIDAIKRITNGMSVGDEPTVQYGSLGKAELQMIKALISHRLYEYFPDHSHAKQFTGCPEYVCKILDAHCNSIETIMVPQKAFKSAIDWSLFKHPNGWIKLQLIHVLFPNTKKILFNATNHDKAWIRDEDIWESILRFLVRNPSTRIRCIEIFLIYEKVGMINQCIVEKYSKALQECFWEIKEKWPEEEQSFISTSLNKVENKFSLLLINNTVVTEIAPASTCDTMEERVLINLN